MKNLLLYLTLLFSSYSYSVMFPVLPGLRITGCQDAPVCRYGKTYASSPTLLIPVTPLNSPYPTMGTEIVPAHLNCLYGTPPISPYDRCTWSRHVRPTGKCRLKSINSWELTSDSTCSVQTTWGPANDASTPSSECVIFGQTSGTNNTNIVTPWGMFNAKETANAPHPFCIRPTPPNVTCEISLPPIIDHGNLSVGDTSRREDDGVINCGGAPMVTVLVDGNSNTNGVQISATPIVVSKTRLRIVSEITTRATAGPGAYSATYVIVASPY